MYSYNYTRVSKIRLRVASMSIVAVILTFSSSSTFAYKAGSKWRDPGGGYPARYIYYTIDTTLDSLLSRYSSLTGTDSTVQNAANKWNTSRFQLVRVSPYNPNGNVVSARNFEYDPPPCSTDPFRTYAVNCIFANETTISRNTIYFNNSANYYWNTWGGFNCNSASLGLPPPWQADVHTIALHEFGHSVELKDFPSGHPEAVMYFNCDQYQKTELREDDKNGATQLYGIRTGWEDGFALGEMDTSAYAVNVRGYGGLSYPELSRRTAEFGTTPVSGSWMELLAGELLSSGAYAYMRLFTSANDSGTQRNYLTIEPGMRLKWFQYNYQQRTMSVDFRMTDGSTLRDSGLATTDGLPVHPAWRHNSPTRQWFWNEVDLTPLAGKTIDQWMIAYDNSQTGWQYVFRAYFDNVRVEY